MNYNTLFILIIVLLFVITVCVHKDINAKNKNKNKKTLVIIPKKKQHNTPLGKGFAEYIPPAKKCSPERNCHTGSYVDFSTSNL